MVFRLRALAVRAADHPRLAAARTLGRLLLTAARRFSAHQCSLLAAAVSYYVMFSIFPLLVFAAGVAGLLLRDPDLQQRAIDAVMDALPLSPTQGRQNLEDLFRTISGPASGGIGLVGLLGSAWSASNMFGALRRSLNVVFEAGDRPLLRAKLTDFVTMGLLGLLLVGSVGATAILALASGRAQGPEGVRPLVTALWLVPTYLLPFVVSLGAFLLLYRLVPARQPSLRAALPGALVAALMFEVAKNLFGLYVRNFANFDVVFGSLGAVAAFLFWVYVSASIALFGAEVSATLAGGEEGRQREASPPA